MDLALTPTGDIYLDGKDVEIQDIVDFAGQRVRLILRSKPGDWALYPEKGAHITQYVGYPNIPATKELVEEELTLELEGDTVLRNFDIEVIYTPLAANAALVEVHVTLPDGEVIEISETIRSTGGIIGSSEPIFTQAEYDLDAEITRTEIVELEEPSNVFRISDVPSNDTVFITPYDESLYIDEETGTVEFPSYIEAQHIDVAGEVQDPLTATFTSGVTSVLENNMIKNLDVQVDGESIPTDEYNADSENLTITTDTPPSGAVDINVEYYDTPAINLITVLPSDAVPNNIFPRSRTTDSIWVTTKGIQGRGKYYLQYTTHPIHGGS